MSSSVRLEILIPTYQRAEVLLQNLEALVGLIRSEGSGEVGIRVRDNASSDGTAELVREFAAKNSDVPWVVEANQENIGGEPNCIALLEASESDYVMYLGDDDFLPQGYLAFVLNEINQNPQLNVIITGFSLINEDGSISPGRDEKYKLKSFAAGFAARCKLMPLGHQLSGLVLRREGTLESYLQGVSSRNLYPFIHFIGYNCGKGESLYAPQYQVLISMGAKKYWSYDRSNLLRDVLINYESIFAGKPFARFVGQFAFLRRNWVRIGGDNILRLPDAFCHVVFWRRLDALTRTALLFLFPWLVIRASAYPVLKAFRSVYLRTKDSLKASQC
ncbi:glycosyltransferase family 2 protein [Novipirellula sp. SH528]|uniref:glycosyltransferase family 2 protein n=1 Tax=Novipirellula sp. SH528 TaxID=3454466 RepID=UPI003FA082A3